MQIPHTWFQFRLELSASGTDLTDGTHTHTKKKNTMWVFLDDKKDNDLTWLHKRDRIRLECDSRMSQKCEKSLFWVVSLLNSRGN